MRAVVKVESNFNPNAVSRKGAMGLMQLMPATARQLKVKNPFDPEQNVDAGVRHLKQLLENYGGDVKLTLAAYNAGAGAVARSAGVPHFAETQNYVRRITNLYYGGSISARPESFARTRSGSTGCAGRALYQQHGLAEAILQEHCSFETLITFSLAVSLRSQRVQNTVQPQQFQPRQNVAGTGRRF